jgi:hypothetical protein
MERRHFSSANVPPHRLYRKYRYAPIGEHVGEAEMLVVLLAVEVEEVGHVNVGDTEGVRLIPWPACRISRTHHSINQP